MNRTVTDQDIEGRLGHINRRLKAATGKVLVRIQAYNKQGFGIADHEEWQERGSYERQLARGMTKREALDYLNAFDDGITYSI